MSVNIINGGLPAIESSVLLAMAINNSGQEIYTGVPIINAPLAGIISSVLYVMPINASGNTLR